MKSVQLKVHEKCTFFDKRSSTRFCRLFSLLCSLCKTVCISRSSAVIFFFLKSFFCGHCSFLFIFFWGEGLCGMSFFSSAQSEASCFFLFSAPRLAWRVIVCTFNLYSDCRGEKIEIHVHKVHWYKLQYTTSLCHYNIASPWHRIRYGGPTLKFPQKRANFKSQERGTLLNCFDEIAHQSYIAVLTENPVG